MHLLQARPGAAVDETEAVDLGQTPGDVVFLSAADTELASLAGARAGFGDGFPSLRLANLMQLAHPMSVDLYVDSVVAKARLVVARVLGGAGYWPYGVEQLAETCRAASIPLALLPGDDQPDPALAALGTVPAQTAHRLWQYCVHGGPANSRNLLAFAADLIGHAVEWREPAPLPRAGLYRPGLGACGFDDLASGWIGGAPAAAVVFYRSHVQAANLAPIDALAHALAARGVNALPLYVSSLKDPASADLVERMLERGRARVVLNATGFAVSTPGAGRRPTPFDAAGRPVLQVVLAGGDEAGWAGGTQGLSARDVAMNVALPEVDGRILARAVSFKAEARFDALTECPVVAYAPRADRVEFTADLARAWIDLAATPAGGRRIGIVLANYPNRDGRLGNGVGLDTPAGTVELLRAMAAAGYGLDAIPPDGNALVEAMAAGPTNAAVAGREIRERLGLDEYLAFFATLPEAVRRAVGERWGAPERDPFFVEPARRGPPGMEPAGAEHGAERPATLGSGPSFFVEPARRAPPGMEPAGSEHGGGRPATLGGGPFSMEPVGEPAGEPVGGGAFAVPALRFGNVMVGLQPARGYNIDPAATYHDPALVPPHGYFAFYAWLRARVHAVVHMGKHGNLEWLPGKALALSAECFPEAALGPMPHVYPFIVNDPGEGAQAKRRAQAVIVDHLTPPLTRAESYGPLAELERLVDEYYDAAGLDPRRLGVLRDAILDLAARLGLDRDCGIASEDGADAALTKLDAWLCELKEMQIRDGLHVFGRSPEGDRLEDLLVALVRLPRGEDSGRDASITRALARDLGLEGFDPLDCEMGARWTGARPAALAGALPPAVVSSSADEPLPAGGSPSPDAPSPADVPASSLAGASPPAGTSSPAVAPPLADAPPPDGARSSANAPSFIEASSSAAAPPSTSATTPPPWRTAGDTVERIEALARALVGGSRPCPESWTRTAAVLSEVEERLRPAVEACAGAEIRGVLTALDGRFVEPGPSGAPTRGRPDVLPTGRNFYSVDTRAVPTPAAWRLGWKSAALLVERHRQEHGEWPRRMALSAWGTSNMRTGGDDVAQAFALMGVRPKWEPSSGRVTGFEILPLDLLDRPRVDVTLRVSGFFRDAFPSQIALLDAAVRAVARLDEPERDNPLAAAYAADAARLAGAGASRQDAERRAGYRIFGSRPGAYGAGLQALIDERGWRDEADLARAWIAWGGYAYGAGAEGAAEHALFEKRLGGVQAVVHNQDNREHDLLDSDDYYQFEGGMAAAVHHLSGVRPAIWHNDHSRPESPRVRRLEEEIARVVRARVVNPKWIRGVMRHGYKGAFEMAATVDYLFAFAATARAVGDHHFDAVFEAYLEDGEVRAFLEENNPAALREIAERLTEALDRRLWRPRSNSVHVALAEIAGR